MRRWRLFPAPVLVLLLAWTTAAPSALDQRGKPSIPARLSDAAFWRLSADLSEPAGYFRSENLVSNEHTFQFVIPDLAQRVAPGGVYLGVAPDQNFTYIAATRPRMAFIVDVRRGNLLTHLMYKALFELSADRAEFISRLFSKRRPAGLTASSTAVELFTAFARVQMTDQEYQAEYAKNLAAVREHLTRKHGFALSAEDLDQLQGIYFAFFWEGPGIRYTTAPSGIGGSRMSGLGSSNFPSFEELQMQTDWGGQPRGYLASEELFKVVKTLQERNLIVPVVGNFAGPKALKAVGQYLTERGATVSAFYVSNVEQYLFMDLLFDKFAANVAALPVTEHSVFIRSVSSRYGYNGPRTWSDGRATALDPILSFVTDFKAGRLRNYSDVNARSR
jgi:hypothetical protein